MLKIHKFNFQFLMIVGTKFTLKVKSLVRHPGLKVPTPQVLGTL